MPAWRLGKQVRNRANDIGKFAKVDLTLSGQTSSGLISQNLTYPVQEIIFMRQFAAYGGSLSWWQDMSDSWYSVEEIAEHLGVSKDTVYAWISKKNMPAHRVGRLWKFQKVEIDNWIKAGGSAEEPETGKGR